MHVVVCKTNDKNNFYLFLAKENLSFQTKSLKSPHNLDKNKLKYLFNKEKDDNFKI